MDVPQRPYVHDAARGEERTKRKEILRGEIARHMELGVEDSEEDDQGLMELVLKMNSLEESSGESREYWLLAITAAREACRLRAEGGHVICLGAKQAAQQLWRL